MRTRELGAAEVGAFGACSSVAGVCGTGGISASRCAFCRKLDNDRLKRAAMGVAVASMLESGGDKSCRREVSPRTRGVEPIDDGLERGGV